MKIMALKNYIFTLIIILSGCTTTELSNAYKPIAVEKGKLPASKRIYYFQHKLISKWVFESEGAFFFDIYNGQIGQLIEAASEIVDSDYANEVTVVPLYDRDAVLIKFPEPKALANCFFALIKKEGNSYSYYTYEKTVNIEGEAVAGVLGGWNSDGGHRNFGLRGYKSENQFIADVFGLDIED
ncbi:hypothetical protein [Microbulbifer sp. 2205BS26-8]|uniref:hypothetical protein n=1 Tax=Microbulbifer sp. 2205BS26-8 TaxID=3064386 RepID=UPI00273FA882|nr:hypothetical protein [Microbulbifer sp. 2205BS26-8]MDP5211311.1 hypothetical protein [Microbulbifer sp. 2205BS26-8]